MQASFGVYMSHADIRSNGRCCSTGTRPDGAIESQLVAKTLPGPTIHSTTGL